MSIYKRKGNCVGKGYAIINQIDKFGYVHITHYKRLYHLKEHMKGTNRKKHVKILVYRHRLFLMKYSKHM